MSHSGVPEPGAADGEFSGAPALRQRLFALASLALLMLGFAALALGALRSLPGVLVPVLALVVAATAGWQALRHRAARRAAWVLVGSVAMIGAVVSALLVGVEYPILAAGMALVAVGAALSGPALSGVGHPQRRLVGRCRSPVLFVNPSSGGGSAERADLADHARAAGVRVIELDGHSDVEALAAEAIADGADALGVAGGDGSMAKVAAAASAAGLPFVCVPAGTRNHFAMDLGLDRSDPVGALDAFGPAVQRRVDVGWSGEHPFVNNVSIGLYGEAVAEDTYRDQPVASALDAAAGLLGPDGTPLDVEFEDGCGNQHTAALVVHVSNNTYELGPGAAPSSRLRLDEGVLGVVAVVPGAVAAAAPTLVSWSCERFTVRGREAVAAGIDGEAAELIPPLEFRVAPQALTVRLPRAAAGVSPAARRPPLTTRTVVRLARVCRGRPAEPDPTDGDRPGGRGNEPSPPIA